MADSTVRSLFARLGFKIDDAKLDEFDRKVDKAKDGMTETVSVADRAREALRKVGDAGKRALGSVADEARAVGQALPGAFKSLGGGIASTIGGVNKVKEVIGFVSQVGATIAEAGEHVGQLEGHLASAGIGIDAAAASTQGLVSDFNLAGGAAAAVRAELVSTDEEFASFAGDVTKLARRAGDDTSNAIGRMAEALRGGNTELLQQYGVVLDNDAVLRDYAGGLGKLVEDLTDSEKAHALQQAAMKAMHDEAEGLGPVLDTNSARIERMSTHVENLGSSLKQGLVAAVGETIGVFEQAAGAIEAFDIAVLTAEKNRRDAAEGGPADFRGLKALIPGAAQAGLAALGQGVAGEFGKAQLQAKEKQADDAAARKAEERLMRAQKRIEQEQEQRLEQEAYDSLQYGPKPADKKKKGAKGPDIPYALRSLVDLDRNVGDDTTDMILEVLQGGGSKTGQEVSFKRKQKKDATTQQLYNQLHRATDDDTRAATEKKLEGHLLDLLKGGEAAAAGLGNGDAARDLGTRIINVDARVITTVEVPAPTGLVGAGPVETRRIAQDLGADIGAQMEPYLQAQIELIKRVIEG